MTPVRKSLLVLLAVAGLAFAGAAIAYSAGLALSGSPRVIQGCVNAKNGDLRIVDPQSAKHNLQQCKDNETTISWNQSGQPGADGAPGANGVSGYEIVAANSAPIAFATDAVVSATCPTGKLPIGGGLSQVTPGALDGAWSVSESYPNGTSWTVHARNVYFPGVSLAFTAYAVCATA